MSRISAFAFVFICFAHFAKANLPPDLAAASFPQLSQTAWQELSKSSGTTKTSGAAASSVTLRAIITAKNGSIEAVQVPEASQLPVTAAEVEAWIKRNWKFARSYTGTVTQPITFRIEHKEPPVQPSPTAGPASSTWGPTTWALFDWASLPIFPQKYWSAVRDFEVEHHKPAGVYVAMTVRNGNLVDLRIIDQLGPPALAYYTVNWIRDHWKFKREVTGIYKTPVYYVIRR